MVVSSQAQAQVEAILAADSLTTQGAEIVAAYQLLTPGPSTWPLIVRLTEHIGNAVRAPAPRLPLGESGVIDEIALLLKHADRPTDYCIQALRVLGNICIDQDENRQRVLDTKVTSTIADLFALNEPKMNMFLCGFCLNTSMNYEPMQKALTEHGMVASLCVFLKAREIGALETMAIKALDNLVNVEEARAQLNNESSEALLDLLTLFVHAWRVDDLEDLEIMETMADIVLQTILYDDAGQLVVARSGHLDDLMQFLENDVTVDGDKEDQDRLNEMKNSVGKIIICATSPDELIDPLYHDDVFMEKLFIMLRGNARMTEAAVYILGNLARTDEKCEGLVQHRELHKQLVGMFNQTDNALTQNGMLGCLRHLCVPKANRALLGDAGVIELVTPLLDPSKDMLKRNQFIAVTILKLLASEPANAARMLNTQNGANNVLANLQAFYSRIDDVGAKSETTRVYIQLIKTVWLQDDTSHLRTHLAQYSIVASITELVRTTKFPVLKNDGYVALTIVLADHDTDAAKGLLKDVVPLLVAAAPTNAIAASEDLDPTADDESETRSFMQVVHMDRVDDKLAKEIRSNVDTFLIMAAKAARAVDNDAIAKEIEQYNNTD
ncbi:armadillo-type protein [Gongronella butleri]|nr:armadillo-type protein [Gongronella butleri]